MAKLNPRTLIRATQSDLYYYRQLESIRAAIAAKDNTARQSQGLLLQSITDKFGAFTFFQF